MERTATARRELVAEPTRLPAAVDLSRLEVEDAVRALRVFAYGVRQKRRQQAEELAAKL